MADANNTSMQSKYSPALWISLIVVAVIVLAGVVYYSQSTGTTGNENSNGNSNTALNTNAATNSNTNSISKNTNRPTNTATNTSVDTSDWKNYMNKTLGFAIKHPDSWSAETITTDVIDHKINDTKLSRGNCPSAGCSIATDLCEVVISSEPDATDPVISEPIDWIKALSSYTGAGVTTTTLGAYNAYATALAVTPAGTNGNQSVGQYFLIAFPTNDEFLSATLRKGFNNSACKAEMTQILQTISN